MRLGGGLWRSTVVPSSAIRVQQYGGGWSWVGVFDDQVTSSVNMLRERLSFDGWSDCHAFHMSAQGKDWSC